MVSSFCVRKSWYIFYFYYHYVRNQYVHFETMWLSICEWFICAYALLLLINTYFLIYSKWLSIGLASLLTYSASLISLWMALLSLFILWFIWMFYMMHLIDLVYELLVAYKFHLENASHLLQVSRLMEAHMST